MNLEAGIRGKDMAGRGRERIYSLACSLSNSTPLHPRSAMAKRTASSNKLLPTPFPRYLNPTVHALTRAFRSFFSSLSTTVPMISSPHLVTSTTVSSAAFPFPLVPSPASSSWTKAHPTCSAATRYPPVAPLTATKSAITAPAPVVSRNGHSRYRASNPSRRTAKATGSGWEMSAREAA